jgi:undecaprenyl-diphosphatase
MRISRYMEIWLLKLINQTLTHPVLDIAMIGLSTVGLAVMLSIGIAFCFYPGQYRKTGLALLLSAGVSLGLALILQYFILRPRPEAVRHLMETPNFPSYPSGHAALVFSAAVILSLTYKRWRWRVGVFIVAMLVAYSRLYLGHHYPSDVIAGAVLGASVGAAGYGLLLRANTGWNWLLWPQIAIALLVTQLAYLGLLPFYLLRWPFADKVFHFLLFGAIVFWLNLWIENRIVRVGLLALPLAILLPLGVAVLEEGAQTFSPYRTVDAGDLASDLIGMIFFWWLSCRVNDLTRRNATYKEV